MPPRRTSPRRATTRPSSFTELGEDEPAGRGAFAAAAPWIALLALVAAFAAFAFVLLNRGTDLSACRSAAWDAIPDSADLPGGWQLGSTDLNANGMTLSILGPASTDGSTAQPAVYASVTCYGDVAATAMSQNKTAAKAAGSSVVNRVGGGDAYDVTSPATGSKTTLFRVGQLIGQIADAGSASPSDLQTITQAVATAMGDEGAAGTAGQPQRSEAAAGSARPGASADLGSAEPSAVAPELEADLPTTIQDTALSPFSTTGDQVLQNFPAARALAARVQSLGAKLTEFQVAQAADPNGGLDITVTGFRLPGLATDKLKAAVLEAWLGANQPGVKTSTVKLSGKTLTKVDYGTNGPSDYIYTTPDHVIVIDTADADAAAEAASQIK